MELLAAFPDVEDLALVLLAPVGATVLATPTVITPPMVQIRRVGGTDDLITDSPRIQVDCFGGTRVQARDMAETCRQLILAAPGTAVGPVSVDAARTEAAPTYMGYGDPNIQRYVGTYRLALRRPR
jgi:hypothetical protein